jgi:transcriptional regulator with XRE-family HTH domain
MVRKRAGVGDTPLRRLREDRLLSQAELAERAHTSQPQIDRLEKGLRRMSVDWAKRLAPALQCHWLDLMGEPQAAYSPQTKAIAEVVEGLSEDDQAAVYRHATALAHGNKPEPLSPRAPAPGHNHQQPARHRAPRAGVHRAR